MNEYDTDAIESLDSVESVDSDESVVTDAEAGADQALEPSTTAIDLTAEAMRDPSVFYAAREDIESLAACPLDNVEPALKRLGPPPFVRKGFPFLGLLATIFDHVAQRVENESRSDFGVQEEADAEESE